MNQTLVFDAGALVAIERRSARIQALIQQARARSVSIVIPTGVVAQVVRTGGRQVNVRRFLSDPALRFAELDYLTAVAIGGLLGNSGTSDVVDAAVVLSAQRNNAPAVTSDPADLRKLDPELPLIEL